MKLTAILTGVAFAVLAMPTTAATLAGVGTFEGVAGVGSANGSVAASPLGANYVYVTTANSSYAGAGLGLGGETSGSILTTNAFAATAGQQLNLSFNYVTSDGAGFADYAYVLLNDLVANSSLTLFTARTTPSGDTVPGFNMPALASGVVLNPGATPIIAGAPTWAELGGDSGGCFSGGCGQTGWINALYTLSTGSYSLSFGVVNWSDNAFDSGLAIAGARVGGDVIVDPNMPAVPVPASAPLLLAGIAGFAALRRRKA